MHGPINEHLFNSYLFNHLLLNVSIVIFVHFKKILLISKYFIMFKMRYQKYGFSVCVHVDPSSANGWPSNAQEAACPKL